MQKESFYGVLNSSKSFLARFICMLYGMWYDILSMQSWIFLKQA